MPMAVTVDEKELQEQVRSHAAFFDRLANLIPARFYVDSDRDPVNLRYLKKSARAQLKREYKEQYKKRKRAKLDPGTADTTLTVQQRQLEAQRSAKDDESDASEDDAEQDERDQSAITENPLSAELPGLNIASEPADRESLRQRLAKRIEAKQKERSAKERSAAAEAAKKWKNSKHRKSVEEARKTQERRAAEGKALKAGGVRDAEETGELEFSKVLHGKDGHHEGKKRKPSKQQQLQAAERAVEQRAQLGATPDAQAALRQEGLKKALKIASGEKVFDDPKLLKRSIKREERKRKKSSREWQQRSKQQQEQQASRQQRRQDNLQRKADQKKKRKIEKREKKLMSRAGFEGRTSKQLTPS